MVAAFPAARWRGESVAADDLHHGDLAMTFDGHLGLQPEGAHAGGRRRRDRHSRTAGLWDHSPLNDLRADPVAHACAIAGRGLTAEEWARYIPELPYRRSCRG
jgi:hypothetical protein